MKETIVIKPLVISLPKEIDDSETYENQISLEEWHRNVAVRKIELNENNIIGGNNP